MAKFTSPHIPSSKKLFSAKKKKPGKTSGLPKSKTKKKRKRGGSKKKKSGMIWSNKPDILVPQFVEECLHYQAPTPIEFQELSYTKTLVEIPQQIQVQVEEHQIYKYRCPNCSTVTGKSFRSLQAMKHYGTLLTVLTTWKLKDIPIADTLRGLIQYSSSLPTIIE